MASLRTRSVLLAAAFVAGTALLTACQGDTDDKASSAATATDSSTEAPAKAEDPSGADSDADGSAPSGTEAPVAGSDSSGTGKTGSESTPESTGGQGKTVSGTWFGNVSYLAPGKYTVSDQKGVEQAFFTSADTEIWGAGDICGDENGQSATKCTEAELEAAAQKGVSAEVKITKGIATRITDDH
ncbi:hypothetical protein ACLVWQ_10540 (plasmid) [Streptomyces sp. CWNU-52B]|uniref:hypothetical protein n=1 Tax=unclassified Streptomyces TaxID=2593676 RepID=UPI0039C35CEA